MQHPPHALLRPGIVIPFVLIALIWGSTWFVIKDGLGRGPAQLVGHLALRARRGGNVRAGVVAARVASG